jgi:hypothetical protein
MMPKIGRKKVQMNMMMPMISCAVEVRMDGECTFIHVDGCVCR